MREFIIATIVNVIRVLVFIGFLRLFGIKIYFRIPKFVKETYNMVKETKNLSRKEEKGGG